ncbi:hypothetical protein OY671_010234 [Metschnikowia pulcherrima]|nr:hypothetical protein OY671_010234 [Metschnikowia pulcherrima]
MGCSTILELLASPAAAQDPTLEESKDAYRSASMADMKKFCTAAEPNKKNTRLSQHVKEASVICRVVRRAYAAGSQKI